MHYHIFAYLKLSVATFLILFIISVYLLGFSDVTFDVIGNSTFASTQEIEAVQETVQGVGEWSTDEIV